MQTDAEFMPLRYDGKTYPNHIVLRDGQVYRWLKTEKRWKPKPHYPRGDGYRGYIITGDWIMAHRAVQESFGSLSPGEVACHNHGTERSHFALSACEPNTTKGNRHDRRRDGTYSTGHNTEPGKLANSVERICTLRREGYSVRRLAKWFQCTRQAVRYQLDVAGIP